MRDLLARPRPPMFTPVQWLIIVAGVIVTLAWAVGCAWFLAAVLQ